MATEPVSVRIYGESYTLRTEESPAYVEELAGYVDACMREIAATGKVVVTARIAVLAALQIADELLRLRRDTESARSETAGRLAALASRLGRALEAADAP